MNYPSIAILDLIGLVYDGSTLSKKGLGGSESAVILISKELAKLGFPVTVFNACNYDDARPGVYDGVTYRPVFDIRETDRFDIVIASRTVKPFVPEHFYPHYDNDTEHPCKIFENLRKNAKLKILWMHDTFCRGDANVEELCVNGYIDKVFTLSDFHTSYITTCDHGRRRNFEVMKDKIFMTRNGVVKYFDEVDISSKDKNLFVYNASLTKGMIPLIDQIWPNVKRIIPSAKLKVVGGFYQFRSDSPLDEQGKRHQVISREQRYKDIDIEFTGVISQKEIAEILCKASFFIFPGAFPETFGISTLEALTYNTPILATRFGALEETAIKNSSYFIDYAIEPNSLFPNINAGEQNNKFIEMTVRAYHDTYLHQQKMNHCNIVKDICTWDTVALQWKQFFFKEFKLYLSSEEYRKVTYINDKVHRVFDRRFSNNVEWNGVKPSKEQPITVISPIWNAENYVENMILSTATQDYENFEHYIIDDCSTDNTVGKILEVLKTLPNDIRKKYILTRNLSNRGAVQNQIDTIRKLNPENIIMLLDGDDALINNNNIFNYYNHLFYNDKTEYAYGSCWSLADNIPLIAQEYPKHIRQNKAYRQYKFNWGMPYPHLRVFRKKLLDNIDDSVFKDENGAWFKAGGDNSTFYNIIEQANPDKIVAVQDIFYFYNDKNPLNDYKVNGELQNMTANKITGNAPTVKLVMKPSEENVDNQKNINIIASQDKIVVSEQPKMNAPIRKKHVLIAIPTAKNIEPSTFKAIYDLIIPEDIEPHFQYFYGYNVDQVRNLIADWVVKGPYDYLFSVDYDISFPPDTLLKLLSHDKDIVSGVYRQRNPDQQILEIFEPNDRGGFVHMLWEKLKPMGNLVKIGACGFGCVLIKKKVMVDIGYPQFQYHSALNHNETFSEDLDFCRKAGFKGFEIYADTTILCDHTGSTVFRVQ
jgi:glycosyltransferase involved in cell wall biosynthesis